MDINAALLVIALSGPVTASSRAAPPATSSATASKPSPVVWTVGLEVRRDHFDYRFENTSRFNTAELVPHFFEQRYDADNVWLIGRVQYHLGRRQLETEGGLTATATGLGSDYDTFFQPDGNVIVYGTTADTALRSWRAVQYVGLGEWGGLVARAGYSYRRDRSFFYASDSTTTQTKPPSSSAFWNTDRETTISEVHEIRLGVSKTIAPGPRWSVRVTADTSPATLARLTTILPDKYAEPVVFMAKGFSLDLGLTATCRVGQWLARASVTFVRTWTYQRASQFHRDGAGVSFFLGR